MKSAEVLLLQIQREQQEHDLLAHRDILNLDTQTRLKHMTLHFLKYAGKIASAREDHDSELLSATLIDTFIICLATANALNVSLGKGWEIYATDLQELAKKISSSQTPTADPFEAALSQLTIIAGRMAKSIESTDHMERGNPRVELEALIVDLSKAMLIRIGVMELPLVSSIRQRWRTVESKSIFATAAIAI